jgi:Ner family transcriptional regulator
MPIEASRPRPPKNPAERRAWLLYQLRIRGKSFRSLAAEAGVSPQAVTHAILNPSSYLEPLIAEAIGLTAPELFPERFDPTGRRLHQTREPQRSTRRSSEKACA